MWGVDHLLNLFLAVWVSSHIHVTKLTRVTWFGIMTTITEDTATTPYRKYAIFPFFAYWWLDFSRLNRPAVRMLIFWKASEQGWGRGRQWPTALVQYRHSPPSIVCCPSRHTKLGQTMPPEIPNASHPPSFSLIQPAVNLQTAIKWWHCTHTNCYALFSLAKDTMRCLILVYL